MSLSPKNQDLPKTKISQKPSVATDQDPLSLRTISIVSYCKQTSNAKCIRETIWPSILCGSSFLLCNNMALTMPLE